MDETRPERYCASRFLTTTERVSTIHINGVSLLPSLFHTSGLGVHYRRAFEEGIIRKWDR